MKKWWLKLIGYRFITYKFIGNCFGEFSVESAITTDIEDKNIPDPDNFFYSSVICWDKDSKTVTYTKSMPNKVCRDHIYCGRLLDRH